MCIYKKRFYKIEDTPGISGFKQWGQKEAFIVSGTNAARHKEYVTGEAHIKPQKRYRLWDGHLKSFCPVVDGLQAIEFLSKNPFQRIEEVE